MKKYIVLLLIISFVIVFFSPYPLSARAMAVSARYKEAGKKLEQLGIVKGYKDGLLHEENYLSQGQALVLLSRTLQVIQKNKRPNLIKISNKFDLFINKVYHAYLIAKNKTLDAYYGLLSLFPRYEVINGVKRGNWMFKDLLYLKRNGFQFPANLNLKARISMQQMLDWEMQILNIGDNNEKIIGKEILTNGEIYSLLSTEHKLLPDSNFPLKNVLYRGDAFLLILNVVEK